MPKNKLDPSKYDELKAALRAAFDGHEDQTDKIGMPYIMHTLAVASAVTEVDEKIVAILHDLLEDTDYEAGDLWDFGISKKNINSVIALTKRSGESYEDYLDRVSRDPVALAVKIADMEHNMSAQRLKDLDEETADRLTTKYRHGLSTLKGGQKLS